MTEQPETASPETDLAAVEQERPAPAWNGQQWLEWSGTEWVALDPQPAPPAAVAQAPAPVVAPPPRTVVVSDRKGKPIQLIVAWVVAVLTIGYMLPWAIAATRGKSNSGAIGLINLLLGWTLIGWIVALVMACSSHQAVAVTR